MFIIDACASKRHFLRAPSGPLRRGEGLCHLEFQVESEVAQNWFVGSADVETAFHQMRIPCGLQAFFCIFRCSCIRSWLYRKIEQKRLSDSLIYLVPTTHPMGFSWRMFFCEDVTDHCTLAGSADSPLFVCRDHSTPPLLGSEHGMGSLGFRWSCADNVGVLARGANCTSVHLARLIAGVQRASLDVHDVAPVSGSADVLGYEVSRANSYCGGAGNRLSGIRSVARTVSSRPRIFLGAQQRFKFALASYLILGEPWSHRRMGT